MPELAHANEMNPWFKIFALMVVGGVAKALFAPQWRPISPAVTQGIMTGIDRGMNKSEKEI